MTQADNFTKDPDIARINRFLAGEPLIAEREEWRVDAMWSALERRVGEEDVSPNAGTKGIGKGGNGYSGKTLPRWVGYSAITATCLAGFAYWQVLRSDSDESEPSKVYTTYATRAGQRASLTLSDGTQITLGPQTTLRAHTGHTATDVEVTGEALFEVDHSVQRPFTVTAYGIVTRVLGTEFVVRAYDASQVRVAVREGRVSVQSPVSTSDNAGIAVAGEAVLVTPNTLPRVKPISDLATEFAWAKGQLVLREVPVGEAFIRLSRWYGKEFRVADPDLLDDAVNGIFPRTFNFASIESLARIINARVTQSGSVLTFTVVKK